MRRSGLLDGGRRKWELDGRPLSNDPVSRPVTSTTASRRITRFRAFHDEVLASHQRQNLSSTCALGEFSADPNPRRTCRGNKASGPDTFLVPISIAVGRAANEDGTFKVR